ncbi:MAG: tripartite tricarboxylate transporter substrate binding protein [Burkholderiales bacterium]
MLKRFARVFAAAASAVFCVAALAQNFPSHPVRIIVPYAPSGNIDITARTLSQAFSEALGQSVIIENRAGAGGTIGTGFVARAPADGYTLLLGSSGTVTAGPAVYKNLPYDATRDLVPVGAIQSVPMVLTAGPKTPVTNFKELLAYAKTKGSPLSMASAGSGSSNHLALELFARETHLQVLHVPYKGSGPALTDLLGGQVETMIDQMTSSIEHIRGGRLKALAVTSLKRSPQLPNVPTLDELGVTGFEATTFSGLFAPTGTPLAVLEKLQVALKKALSIESVRERYRSMGVEMMDMSPAEFAAFVRADLEKWRKVAREANIVLD